MKKISSAVLLVILTAALYVSATAGSISGTVSYSGASTGIIYAAAFTSMAIKGSPTAYATLNAPGSYTIPGLADGTYYIVSVMNADSVSMTKLTDPWGAYGSSDALTPVTISGGNNVTGINMTMVNGTAEKPNPFYVKPVTPTLIRQLPDATRGGSNRSLATDGSSLYLYHHDYAGAGTGTLFKIDPSSGAVTATYVLYLQSLPGSVSWIDKIIFHKGAMWANGAYGASSGTGATVGIFKVDIASSTVSNQLPTGTGIDVTNELGGMASDGVNLYVGVDLIGVTTTHGIVKFDPTAVSAIPTAPCIAMSTRPDYFSYGDNCLWVGLDSLNKLDPALGTVLGKYNIPEKAAAVYHDDMFWRYNDADNTLEAYSLVPTGVANGIDHSSPSTFSLSQNYPNPFNPTTVISYHLPAGQAGLAVNSDVTLRVYDVMGREVATLVDEKKDAGVYSIRFDGSALPSGVYFYRLQAGTFTETKSMMLLK